MAIAPQDPAAPAGAGTPPADGADASTQRFADGVKLVGGLFVVCAGLLVILLVVLVSVYLVRKHPSQVVALAASAFSIVGTLVGTYFGLKIGSDGTKAAIASTDRTVSALQDESAKAQAFAANVPVENAAQAINQAAGLAPGNPATLPALPDQGNAGTDPAAPAGP